MPLETELNIFLYTSTSRNCRLKQHKHDLISDYYQ